MTKLRQLLSIRPGEGMKVGLLCLLHFLFYLGLMWGDKAQLALFLDSWSARDLSLIFIGNAFLAITIGLIYTSIVDRISNRRVLLMLIGVMVVWLVSVQLLLSAGFGGKRSLVYLYFSLVYQAFRDLSTLHILNYINDFFDIRSAKRMLPLILAAGTAGGVAAGFSAPVLAGVGLELVPSAWIVCLVLCVGLVALIQRRRLLPVSAADPQAAEPLPSDQGALANLREGFQFVHKTAILRWLAFGTFAMVILMNLLIFMSGAYLEEHFEGNRDGLFQFLGVVDGTADAIGLLIQSLLLSRILSLVGVAKLSLFFPSVTVVGVTLLGLYPRLATAVFGRLNHSTIKQAFRNPLDAMLFNSVPPGVKNRAKGFVNGLIVPLGSLLAGVLLVAARYELVSMPAVVITAIVISVLYVGAGWRIRREYGQSLASLLSNDEMALFRVALSSLDPVDPASFRLLRERLASETDEDRLVVLVEIVWNLRGREGLGDLLAIYRRASPPLRASIIDIVSQRKPGRVTRKLFLEALEDQDVLVRKAAAIAIGKYPGSFQDEDTLSRLHTLLEESDLEIQAAVIPPLIASGDFEFLAEPVRILSDWLHDQEDSRRRIRGLTTLAATGSERLARTVVRFVADPSPDVRRTAVSLIEGLTASAPMAEIRDLGRRNLIRLLGDADESVRMSAVAGLSRFPVTERGERFFLAFGDSSFRVRRRACRSIGESLTTDRIEKLDLEQRFVRECVAFIRASREDATKPALEVIEQLVEDAFHWVLQQESLGGLKQPSAQLLCLTLEEHIGLSLRRVEWLLGASHSKKQIESIFRALAVASADEKINATEALESVTSPHLARLIPPLLERGRPNALKVAGELLELPTPEIGEVVRQLWPGLDEAHPVHPSTDDLNGSHRDGWVMALVVQLLHHPRSDLEAFGLTEASLQRATRATLAENPKLMICVQGEQTENGDSGKSKSKENTMLMPIERVIFLKQVPFFRGMSVSQLRVLADISEYKAFKSGETIIREGDRGDALHVVVRGGVEVQRRSETETVTLATLGPGEYFAEMSVFDNEPYSADVLAKSGTDLLLVRKAPLVALVKRHPSLAFDLLQVFSQRLRSANALFSQGSQR